MEWPSSIHLGQWSSLLMAKTQQTFCHWRTMLAQTTPISLPNPSPTPHQEQMRCQIVKRTLSTWRISKQRNLCSARDLATSLKSHQMVPQTFKEPNSPMSLSGSPTKLTSQEILTIPTSLITLQHTLAPMKMRLSYLPWEPGRTHATKDKTVTGDQKMPQRLVKCIWPLNCSDQHLEMQDFSSTTSWSTETSWGCLHKARDGRQEDGRDLMTLPLSSLTRALTKSRSQTFLETLSKPSSMTSEPVAVPTNGWKTCSLPSLLTNDRLTITTRKQPKPKQLVILHFS